MNAKLLTLHGDEIEGFCHGDALLLGSDSADAALLGEELYGILMGDDMMEGEEMEGVDYVEGVEMLGFDPKNNPDLLGFAMTIGALFAGVKLALPFIKKGIGLIKKGKGIGKIGGAIRNLVDRLKKGGKKESAAKLETALVTATAQGAAKAGVSPSVAMQAQQQVADKSNPTKKTNPLAFAPLAILPFLL